MNTKTKKDVIEMQGDGLEITPAEMQQVPPTNVISQADRLVEMAITSGADIDRLDKLLDLKERYDKEDARKQFTSALANFKSAQLEIKKDKMVSFKSKDGMTEYSHATLGNVVGIAVPELAKNGLSHRWDVVQKDARVEVTCILTHKGGHSESVSMNASPDDTGKKNPIQQVASTVTYLERYTFLAITGLAVEDQMEDDGAASAAPIEYITEDEVNTLHSMVKDNELDLGILLHWVFTQMGADSLEKIPENKFAEVKAKIQFAIDKKAAK